jgi:hypothetical protein
VVASAEFAERQLQQAQSKRSTVHMWLAGDQLGDRVFAD